MERDITKIIKLEYLLPELQRAVDARQRGLDKWKAEFERSPKYALEGSDKAFRATAELTVLASLHARYNHIFANTALSETTFEAIKNDVWEELKHKRAVPSSTSPGHSLMEQHLLEVLMDCQRNAYLLNSIVTEAQWKDPEHQAYMTARAEENRKNAEAKRLADEQAKRDARKARRNANKGNV